MILVTTYTLPLLQQVDVTAQLPLMPLLMSKCSRTVATDELIAVPLVKRDLGPIRGVSYQYQYEKEASIDFIEY